MLGNISSVQGAIFVQAGRYKHHYDETESTVTLQDSKLKHLDTSEIFEIFQRLSLLSQPKARQS